MKKLKPKKLPSLSFITILSIVIISLSCNSPHTEKKLPWSVRMAKSVIKHHPEAWMVDFKNKPKWGYMQGLVLKAVLQVWQTNGHSELKEYVDTYYDRFVKEDGTIETYDLKEYNIDRINAGKPLFQIYRETGQDKYKKAIFLLRKQMETHPRTKVGGFWHKKIYPYQMWLDGLYMASPFLAEFAKTFDQPEMFDDIAQQYILMEKYARDEKTGLLYHGWDESRQQRWADPKTGLSPHFWGRGMGWYAMALVDVLYFFPEDHAKYNEIIAILKRLSTAIAKFQDDKTGLWYQIVDQGNREGNYLESSASCMFVYSLLKGLKKGYIDSSFLAVAKKGYDGILKNFIEVDDEGLVHIHKACAGAGLGGNPYRDGSYEYYINEKIRSNDPKAAGPFILASLELESMSKNTDTGQYTKGRLIYKNKLDSKASVQDWIMEGPGELKFESGWMDMCSPEEQGHHVFWCPENFPESFVAEWEARNIETDAGLCIIFFAAKGEKGEDIFDSSLPPRDGTFKQYTQGKIVSYHISYYANAAHRPDRNDSHLRKNNTFSLVQTGEVGIPTKSKEIHKMKLIKDGPHIIMFIDDRKIIDWIDNGIDYGPAHTDGKIGFRQMKWTHFRYRNFKVWERVMYSKKGKDKMEKDQTMYNRVNDVINVIKKHTKVIILGDPEKSVLAVTPEHGNKVIAMSVNGLEGNNLLWTNPQISSEEFWKDEKQFWNIGGSRTWISPEADFYIDRQKNWFVPKEMDPGNYKLNSQDDKTVVCSNKFQIQNVKNQHYHLEFIRSIQLIDYPLETEIAGTKYIGMKITHELINHSDKIIGKDLDYAGLWSLIQLNASGTMIIPIKKNLSQDNMTIRDYGPKNFNTVPPERMSISDNCVSVKIDGKFRCKLGFHPQAVRNSIAYFYYNQYSEESILFIKEFHVDPEGLYLDHPWEKAYDYGDAVQLYNDGGDMGGFCEIECHGPVKILNPGESMNHTIHLSVFVDKLARLKEIAAEKLEVDMDQVKLY